MAVRSSQGADYTKPLYLRPAGGELLRGRPQPLWAVAAWQLRLDVTCLARTERSLRGGLVRSKPNSSKPPIANCQRGPITLRRTSPQHTRTHGSDQTGEAPAQRTSRPADDPQAPANTHRRLRGGLVGRTRRWVGGVADWLRAPISIRAHSAAAPRHAIARTAEPDSLTDSADDRCASMYGRCLKTSAPVQAGFIRPRLNWLRGSMTSCLTLHAPRA
jgi:hypothetical protein